ncbi:hypothetical protein, partial [Pseudomonas aeruginosa]
MSLNMFWFLPTHGDGHYLGTEEGSRPVEKTCQGDARPIVAA